MTAARRIGVQGTAFVLAWDLFAKRTSDWVSRIGFEIGFVGRPWNWGAAFASSHTVEPVVEPNFAP